MPNAIFAVSANISFYNTKAFEPPQNADDIHTRARNAFRLLFMGWDKQWQDIIHGRLFTAVLAHRDPEVLSIARKEFQHGFLNIYQQLCSRNFSELEHRAIALYLANIISYITFLDPTPNEVFNIPQWINNKWELVTYHITPIELTSPTSLTRQQDRVFAYGFEPINQPEAVSHLAFAGTSYPSGQGFGESIYADLEPLTTVGESLYRSGKQSITAWLDSQNGHSIHVCGASLGGALALLLATDQPEKIKRVDALNAPGLFPFRLRGNLDHWQSAKRKPEVVIQKQLHDHVSALGVWKPEWTVLRITPGISHGGPKNAAHILQYANQPDVTIEQIDTAEDNARLERKLRNFFVYGALRTIAYLLIAIPWLVIARPIKNLFTHLFGRDNKDMPAIDKSLNTDMHIAKSTQEKTISLNDLGIYYYLQRCAIKGKSFAPATGKQEKSSIEFIGQDKRTVLEKIRASDPASLSETIKIKCSSAKLYQIERTLNIAHRHGFTHFKSLNEKTTVAQPISTEIKSIKHQYKSRKIRQENHKSTESQQNNCRPFDRAC